MTSVRLQDAGDILLGTKGGGKQPERVWEELQRNDQPFGNLEMVPSDVGSQSQSRRLTTNSEEALTCTLAIGPYCIGEHGLASLAEGAVRLFTPFRRNSCTGIIGRQFKQRQACDRL